VAQQPASVRGILGSSPPTADAPFTSSARGVSGCCVATDADAGVCSCSGGRVDCAVVAPTATAAASSSADGAGMRSGTILPPEKSSAAALLSMLGNGGSPSSSAPRRVGPEGAGGPGGRMAKRGASASLPRETCGKAIEIATRLN